jgi:hypothetical protein
VNSTRALSLTLIMPNTLSGNGLNKEGQRYKALAGKPTLG